MEIGQWAAEVWVEEEQQANALANIEGLRQAAALSASPDVFFSKLNAFEIKHQNLKRKASAFLTLASIPSVKGLEFGHVVIPYLEHGQFPRTATTHERSAVDERALFYVAMTRARDSLTLLSSQREPSIFVSEITSTQKN